MQIFSPSHIHSSSRNNARSRSLGFTLVELLISAAIIGIISTIVLVKYGSFDSSTLLKSAAYEVALTLREAQVKSVSVSGSTNFDYPYGVSFTPGSTRYYAFVYQNSLLNHPRWNTTPGAAITLATSTFQRSIRIHEICIKQVSVAQEKCSTSATNPLSRLDISFRRPEYKSLYYVMDGVGGYDETVTTSSQGTFEYAKIKLKSPTGTAVFVVEVSALGQISISKE